MTLIVDGSRGKVMGAFLVRDGSSAGWTHAADTRQCVHCGNHFEIRPGSGIVRGWCSHCNGPECGAERCFTCLPYEQWMEIIEAASRKLELAGAVLLDGTSIIDPVTLMPTLRNVVLL